jgi:RNA polymerase sigma-70 factor (ECF subfamily)
MKSTVDSWRDDVLALIPALRAFGWSLSRNASDADDLVQETLIKAWTHRDRFEAGTNLRAWLFTILRNTHYTTIARRRREVRDQDGKFAAALSTASTQQWTVEVRALWDVMMTLPDDYREALMLVAAAGVSYEEAAEICGCAVGTIKSRVHRARARLVEILDGDPSLEAGSDGSISALRTSQFY